MKRILILLIACALLAPAVFAAEGLEGVYDCVGSNPGGSGQYRGTVTIARNGDNYNVTWNIGTQVYLGIGILQGDTFSVGYTDAKKSWYGVVVYKVDGKKLTGVWAMPGNAKNGKETLTRR